MSVEPGLTTADVAKRYRVGQDKVRAWITSGALRAINTASTTCAKPRYIVTADALESFERGRCASRPAKPPRQRKLKAVTDHFPD